MEAERSYTLPSESWRLGKLVVQFQSEYKGLRTGNSDDVRTSSRAGEDQYPHSSGQEERENSTVLCFFFLFSPSADWIMLTHIGKDHLLYSNHSLPETHSEIMFNQSS